MVRIALDPTPYHHDFGLLDFPDVVARLGYEHFQLTPELTRQFLGQLP